MDRRHYTSMLLLVGIVAIAWVLAKMQPKEGGAAGAEHSSVFVQTNTLAPEASSLDVADIESSAQTATPQIPGLLDDDPSAEFQLTDGTNLSTRSSPLPLKTISSDRSGQVSNSISATETKEELLGDGSTTRVRTLPTFSMPNTQNPILTRQQNRGANTSDLQPLSPAGNPRPLGVDSSQQGPGNQSLPSQLLPNNSGNQESSYQPLTLPNNRHVLRPIIRSQHRETGDSGFAQQKLPHQPLQGSPARSTANGSETNGPEAAGTADWGAPMPGVRVRPEAMRETGQSAPNANASNRQETLPLNPRFAPPTTSAPDPSLAVAGSSDPLFALAVQDLYRLPSEQQASVTGVSPTTNATTAGHSISPSTMPYKPLRPRTPHPRPGGRPSSDYIWHVIKPNQSLEAISYQYFGDEGGIARLIEFNTDVFDNPKLLPVGKAIRIPLR